MKYKSYLLILAAFVLGLVSCGDEASPSDSKTVKIGGLLSITGSWNSLGINADVAAKLAVEDINKHYKSLGSDTVFSWENYDTKLEGVKALEGLKSLKSKGVRFFIGPQSSSEAAAVKSFIDTSNIVVISPSSTAGSLALENDNLLRMCPSDAAEGPAIAAMMKAEGRTMVFSMWRDDIGNKGLFDSMKEAGEKIGVVVGYNISYSPDDINFTTEIDNVRSQVQQLVDIGGTTADIGIYNPAFDEAALIAAAIPPGDILREVRWYGGDGTVGSAALAEEGAFFEEVGYACPAFGIGPEAVNAASVAARIKAVTGQDPDAFALAVYDAVWLIAKAAMSGADISMATGLRSAIMAQAETYYGTTGHNKMNKYGDREQANFDMMGLKEEEDAYKWKLMGTYSSATGTYTPAP